MNNFEFLPYPEITPEGEPEKLIVFLHGVGSDGHDLISLVPFFEEELKSQNSDSDGYAAFHNTHFISPHGIQPYDMAPFGRQWFSLIDRTPNVIIELARNNAPAIEEIIKKKQDELGLGNKDTIIIGFSQGTMMGIYLTLTQKDPYAAMIGFSGRFIPPKEISNKNTPICLVHGENDEIVEAVESDKMADFFTQENIKCEKIIVPNLTHSIDATGIRFASKFLNKYLSA